MRCRYSGPRGKSGFGCQFERMVAAAIGSQSSPKTSQPHAARDPGPFNAHNPDGGRSGLVQHVLRSPARIPAIGISVQGSVRRAGKRKTLYVIIRKIGGVGEGVLLSTGDVGGPTWGRAGVPASKSTAQCECLSFDSLYAHVGPRDHL